MFPEAPIRIAVMLSPASGDGCVEFSRFLAVYYALLDAGAEMLLASVSGGYPWPTRPKRPGGEGSELAARFRSDRHARDDLANTLTFGQVFIEDFHGGFCVGLPGSIWSSNDDGLAGSLIGRFLQAGKPVAVLPSLFDIQPKGAGGGLLIIGDGDWPPSRAVHALLASVPRLSEKERTLP
ncbi:transporter [Mesorhizobium sp. M1307]|uniref:transporter n=1 Tax=unclassified Mesorhizobium TaxID=325217 RepID=UPI0033365F3E